MASLHRSHHRSHRKGRTRRAPRMLWVGFAALAAFGIVSAVLLVDPAAVPRGTAGELWQKAITLGRQAKSAADIPQDKRVIYPYSIVAGGVHNKAEFEEAMKTDPVAAAHYADFNPSKFHLVKLQKPMFAYVSFRVGDNVYWTNHKVELRAGDVLISDGEHLGRTRCGNRVCATPKLPTYDHEPSEKELNTPVRPRVETEAFNAVAPAPPGGGGETPASLLAPAGGSSTPSTGTPGGVGGIGPLLGAPPIGCSSKTSNSSNGNNKTSTTNTGGSSNSGKKTQDNCVTTLTVIVPPTPTPENNSWVLWLSGALILAGYGVVRRRRSILS